ncbi:PD-(D/E)XK nuclease family protein [Nitrosophilus labii]|uniref:PD-(D/E)XK nuclease family protein n=1 Tax=Nitrosophilus labii TaxID=2706014 RepID=UPI0016572516|nr:PD-(D/E)XK nuclease family protein [Nitrosophilus labii]
MKLYVFPTSRALRKEREKLLQNESFLPKLTTIDDFETRAVIVPSKVYANDDTRLILLKKAADFKDFKKLHIDDEFFRFIKNSSYFFRFFEELENERVKFDLLKEADIYAEYSEHIEILEFLKKRYEKLLDKHGYFDNITLPKEYILNENYLKGFESVTIKLEGFLTNFELEILEKASKITEIVIEYKCNKYNKKMTQRFEKYDFKLEDGYLYRLNISEKSYKKVEQLKNRCKGRYISFLNRISQVAYVKKKIDEFIKSGIEPENIAIILPDESFKEYLDLFDTLNNLNFAMGFDFSKSEVFKALSIFEESLKISNIETEYEIKKFGLEDIVEKWKERSNRTLSFEEFRLLIEDFLLFARKDETKILKEELEDFSFLYPYLKDYSLKKILHIFINRLREKKLDDTKGGKITVLGLLETRGVDFEAVIVPDFNEGLVPKPSEKDLFLDSVLRKKASLPTKKDRENLQKYYYYELFRKAKFAAVSYVENEIDSKSRFLEELDFLEKERYEGKSLNKILLDFKETNFFEDRDIVIDYDFSEEFISSTKLKDFLECPRRFYYKYIKGLKDFPMPSILPKNNEAGNILHESLKSVYDKKDRYFSVEELKKEFKRSVYSILESNNLYLRLDIDIWIKKLEPFFENEVKRFNEGYYVFEREKRKYTEFEGFKLEGKIDRVDHNGKYYQVIDYKSSKVESPTKKSLENLKDFQLIFYYLLIKDIGEIEGLYYYDLNSAKMVKEQFLEEKIELLRETLNELREKRVDFKKCDDLKYCRYCPYKIICNRM